MSVPDDHLVALAIGSLKNSYCPYSKFPVGAALLCEDGTIIHGVNVENASYGGTICAERTAFCTAVAQGKRKFKAIAIATNLDEPASPCGLCRQFMIEFGNFKVILASNSSSKRIVTTMKELLPLAFTPSSLDDYELQQNGTTAKI